MKKFLSVFFVFALFSASCMTVQAAEDKTYIYVRRPTRQRSKSKKEKAALRLFLLE